MIDTIVKSANFMHSRATPAERGARIVESCLIRPKGRTRVLIGLGAMMLSFGWLPDRWLDALLGRS